jgi:(2R)-ethylmalonyl-CoA mutase
VAAAFGRRTEGLAGVAARVRALPGGPPRFLLAKPGLDGHSNGAEQLAVAARDAGFEVIYAGIRLLPEQVVVSARDEDVDVIGLSILSGSHVELVRTILAGLRAEGVDAPVVVGGIIPEEDHPLLRAEGVAAIFTPKDFELARIVDALVDLVVTHRAR